MTTRERTARPPLLAVIFNYLSYLLLFAICGVMLFLAWPVVMARLAQSGVALPSLPTIATAYVAPLSRPQAAPQSAPALNLEQVSATSTAIYQATAAAVDAHPPNVNTTGDSAPLVVEQKPSVREPAGLVVPTAEPVALPQSDDQTGSKPVLVNPQATHTCRHGQEWVDGKGCRNP